MKTNRTGTAKWKRIRKKRREEAIDNGIFNCPECGIGLDYEYSRRPNSAEVDHIRAHSQGGQDLYQNTRVICRHCNQSLGGKQNKGRRRGPKQVVPRPLKSSRNI